MDAWAFLTEDDDARRDLREGLALARLDIADEFAEEVSEDGS
jgi:hypothetical protein